MKTQSYYYYSHRRQNFVLSVEVSQADAMVKYLASKGHTNVENHAVGCYVRFLLPQDEGLLSLIMHRSTRIADPQVKGRDHRYEQWLAKQQPKSGTTPAPAQQPKSKATPASAQQGITVEILEKQAANLSQFRLNEYARKYKVDTSLDKKAKVAAVAKAAYAAKHAPKAAV